MASRPPTEQQVVLDADGRPVQAAMDAIVRKVGTIQNQITDILKTAKAGSKEFDDALGLTIQRLRTAMGELRTLQSPGANIQLLNNNRGLARATVQASDYARTLGMARNTVEALQGKINDLNRTIAGRGANGQAATVAQRDRLTLYERQLAAIKALETQQDRLERRAARTRGGDLTAERRALEQATQRLQSAALDPSRHSVAREIRAAQLAQDHFTEALNRSRTAAASLAREQREIARAARAVAPFEIRRQIEGGANPRTLMVGYQYEAARAAERLAGATSEERAAAMQALELAKARAREAERLVNSAEREATAVQRRNIAEEAAAARLRGQTRREYLVGEAAAIRDPAALDAARIANANRLTDLRRRARDATGEEARIILQEIQLEKAVGTELQRNLNTRKAETREAEKRAAADVASARVSGGGAGGGGFGARFGLPAGGFPTVLARTAAYGAAGVGIFAFLSTIRQGLQFVVQFEDGLKRLQAISASTDGVMGQLSGTILGVGESSRFSLIDITEMATKLAQAGVSASQMGEALESVARLATASGSTPQEAVDLVTAALGAFQLAANETPRIADMITTALNRTRLTVEQAALAIQYVGSTAYEQNISLEQLLATTAALSQAGIRSGSTIGTGMRQFLVDLQSPSDKLTETLQRLNISMADVDVTTRGLPAVLNTLNQAGFGAAQAYGSLETRAAAFYVTARNNTDLMAELQMQFAEQGAAMVANERAMDSLAAQWQRFKNIVGEDVADTLGPLLTTAKNVVRQLADMISNAQNAMERNRQAGPDEGLYDDQALQRRVEDFIEAALNMDFNNRFIDTGGSTGIGTWLRNLGRDASDASGQMEILNTRMQNQSETVNMYEDRVRSLDHEIGRLITQQDSLQRTHGAVSAETVTLASRFEGLSRFLVGTTNDVTGLIEALRALRNEEAGQLIESIQGQVATANQQTLAGRNNRNAAIENFRNSPSYRLLNRQERQALDTLANPNATPDQRRLAAQLLSDRQNVWTREGRTGAVNALTPILTANAQAATAEGTALRGRRRIGDLTFQRSPIGVDINRRFEQVDALITQLRTASPAERTSISNRIEGLLRPLEAQINRNIGTNPERNPHQVQARQEIASFRQSVRAIMTPTAEQQREAARAVRTGDRAGRTMQLQAPIPGAQISSGFGMRTHPITGRRTMHPAIDYRAGRGTPVQAAGQGRVKTASNNANQPNGRHVVIDHGNGLETWYLHLDEVRVRANQIVEAGDVIGTVGSTGMATGNHLDFRVKSGGNFVNPAAHNWRFEANPAEATSQAVQVEEERAERNAVANQRLGVRNAESNLRGRIRDLRFSTSADVFQLGQNAVEAAFEDWAEQTRAMAEAELDRREATEGERSEYMSEVEERIRQKADEVQTALFEAIMRNLERQLEVVEENFESAIRPSQQAIQRAEAVASGFSYFSNLGRIPDYVEQLQQGRIGRAQEAAARARQQALPARIAGVEGLMGQTALRMAGELDMGRLETLNDRLTELGDTLAELRAEKEALDASFAAGGLVPTSLSDGLNQAVAAYREAHVLTRSFKEELIYNLGGALTTVHDGITKMFEDIMTGSRTVLQAFGDFVQGMIQYMIQLAARALATRVFNLLVSALAPSVGASAGASTAASGAAAGAAAGGWMGAFGGGTNINGVPIGADGLARLARGGGRVMNGSSLKDSVNAKIARDEWVINSRAVRSVGHDFMANLNAHGAAALDALRSSPSIAMPSQEVNVYVTRPDIPRQMGKNDILVAVQEDILSGGETKKLIKHVQQGG